MPATQVHDQSVDSSDGPAWAWRIRKYADARLAPTQRVPFPFRVLVVKVPMAVDAERMRQILAPDEKQPLSDGRRRTQPSMAIQASPRQCGLGECRPKIKKFVSRLGRMLYGKFMQYSGYGRFGFEI